MSAKFTIQELTKDEFLPLFNQHQKTVFEDIHSYGLPDLLYGHELDRYQELKKSTDDLYKLYLAAFDENNNFVGWSWGTQEYGATYCMINSAVLPTHRRQGIYGALLDRCIEIVSKQGFQIIYSRHHVTNNAVIIPKLKAGFTISKMELDDKFGVLVHLHYYTNKIRRQIMDYRSGYTQPNKEIKKIFRV